MTAVHSPAPRARFIVLWSTPTDIAAFDDHYRNIHIPLAHRMTRLLSYTVGRDVRAIRGAESLHVIGELEWATMDDLQTDFRSPEGRATAEDVEILSQWSPGVRSFIFEVDPT